MMSTEAQTQNQFQQSTRYDEGVFNQRIRQLFNSIDSTNNNMSQMTSIGDAIFPEEVSLHQQQRNQRNLSTNDLTTHFDRCALWNHSINSNSASTFCGDITNGSSAFVNRRQSTVHSPSYSLRNNQQHHNRPVSRTRFNSSSVYLSVGATISLPNSNNTNELQRSSSSLSTNSTTDYQSRFASCLSTTAPAGSYDQIALSCSTSPVLSRNTSTTNAQPQQFSTTTPTKTITFSYIPASDSLAYNYLVETDRSTTVSHH